MKYWLGVTDRDWFEHLAPRAPDEVNFWQPSAKPLARFLQPGTPFLFKLHSPDDYVVGGGFFVRFTALPATIAWMAFGEKNGVADQASLNARIRLYRGPGARSSDPIGCNVLAEPFFFARDDWIPVPANWARNIVRGKTYDSGEVHGARLWAAVEERLVRLEPAEIASRNPEDPRYGAEYLARARLGQGSFRILVTDAYHRRCAVTGERTLPALEAAHIRPYAAEGPHRVSNGLLLRADIHRLFDDGYVTIDRHREDDLRFVVSPRVHEEFENGREYYRFNGQRLINLPDATSERPSREFVNWHNERVYGG